MEIRVTEKRRLLPGGKFAFLRDDNEKNGDESLWRQLRAGKAVKIDAKELLNGNGLKTPSGQSTKSFIEFELGVEVTKCSKGEEAIVGSVKEDILFDGGVDLLPKTVKAIEQYEEEKEKSEKEKSGGEK